jgi:hypothetical protein
MGKPPKRTQLANYRTQHLVALQGRAGLGKLPDLGHDKSPFGSDESRD